LPIGYSDGYDRSLSNLSYVLIKGKRAPVRSRVCMNLTMVDVTDISGVKLEEPVTLIGTDKKEMITAEQLAGWAGTINYEILARLSPNTVRVLTDK
jgi:alanine racemase